MVYLPTLGEKWPHEQWEMYVHIPIPWILWVRNSFSMDHLFRNFLGVWSWTSRPLTPQN